MAEKGYNPLEDFLGRERSPLPKGVEGLKHFQGPGKAAFMQEDFLDALEKLFEKQGDMKSRATLRKFRSAEFVSDEAWRAMRRSVGGNMSLLEQLPFAGTDKNKAAFQRMLSQLYLSDKDDLPQVVAKASEKFRPAKGVREKAYHANIEERSLSDKATRDLESKRVARESKKVSAGKKFKRGLPSQVFPEPLISEEVSKSKIKPRTFLKGGNVITVTPIETPLRIRQKTKRSLKQVRRKGGKISGPAMRSLAPKAGPLPHKEKVGKLTRPGDTWQVTMRDESGKVLRSTEVSKDQLKATISKIEKGGFIEESPKLGGRGKTGRTEKQIMLARDAYTKEGGSLTAGGSGGPSGYTSGKPTISKGSKIAASAAAMQQAANLTAANTVYLRDSTGTFWEMSPTVQKYRGGTRISPDIKPTKGVEYKNTYRIRRFKGKKLGGIGKAINLGSPLNKALGEIAGMNPAISSKHEIFIKPETAEKLVQGTGKFGLGEIGKRKGIRKGLAITEPGKAPTSKEMSTVFSSLRKMRGLPAMALLLLLLGVGSGAMFGTDSKAA